MTPSIEFNDNNRLTFKLVRGQEDLERAYALEVDGYPADEAASLDKLAYRQEHAPDLFLGAYLATGDDDNAADGPPLLIGFIVGTRARDAHTLTHASMSEHDPRGTTICIHSVCVGRSYRRRGIATRLMAAYVRRLRASARSERLLLIAHWELATKLYVERCGFRMLGPSAVVHGSEQWFECGMELCNEL